MASSAVVAGRFQIEQQAGRGGMATVYRARDLSKPEHPIVALKVLRAAHGYDAERFEREARVLADLRHPGIVGYVDHGTTVEGERYLAMEWLEGEDLSARLARGALSVDDALVLARRVTAALSVVHARGVVHRDVKPSNIFLRDGDVGRATLLDFGVARREEPGEFHTLTGALLGTPAYMAPEQARGTRNPDARVDVYALGCVLHECLTGKAAFSGAHAMAVLSKVLLETPPRLRLTRADVPSALDELVASMLAKEPALRPTDGAAVLAALPAEDARRETPVPRPPSTSLKSAALTSLERRTVSVVLSGHVPTTAGPDDDTSSDEAPTARATGAPQLLAQAMKALGGTLERLVDGSLLVVVDGRGEATDQASRAARCALELRRARPEAAVVVATGHGETSARYPVGEVIDRAVALLARANAGDAIAIDDATAGLLDARFEISGGASGLALRGEQVRVESSRTLLGKATSCVGREQDLRTLGSLYDDCVADRRARAVLLTAPAGTGKSRVRFELMRELGARTAPPLVFLFRADSTSAGSPFGLLGPALRREAGIIEGESIEARRQKWRARVGRHVHPVELERVSEFLGELAGVPFDDGESVQLRAARRDPIVMGDQMRRAWEDFLAAECEAQPVVLVLEDLHWGDLPTVRLVDNALATLAEKPLYVLALARPEVDELFPKLWAERDLTIIRLRPLPKRASEQLAREVLGPDASAERIARVVEQSGGNALFLEELLRAEREGKGDSPPETVLALVEARLERLPQSTRRALRAASVFGQIFWRDGVAALLGPEEAGAADIFLSELVSREVVSTRKPSRFPDTDEYIFRHALVRDAAYAMLTAEDRALGHRLAGAWLLARSESDALVLAGHFDKGNEPAAAIDHYLEAATQALEGNDFASALARAQRGIACGASGDRLGALHGVEAEAHRWRGEHELAERASAAALPNLKRPNPAWYKVVAEHIEASGSLGHLESLLADADALRQEDQPVDSSMRVIAAAHAVVQLNHHGRYAQAQALLDAIRNSCAGRSVDPTVGAWIGRAAFMRAASDANPGALLSACLASAEGFADAGDLRMASFQRVNLGYAMTVVGQWEEACRVLSTMEAQARRLGLVQLPPLARSYQGYALTQLGRVKEGAAMLRGAIESLRSPGERRILARAHNYLARGLADSGALDDAAREVEIALEISKELPVVNALCQGTASHIAIRRNRADEALAHAGKALAVLAERGSVEDGETLLRVSHAEALHATGQTQTACEVIGAARVSVQRRAQTIEDSKVRASFLEHVSENARTLRVAIELLDGKSLTDLGS